MINDEDKIPLVSIIILHVHYNERNYEYLEMCLEAIHNSTFKNFEVIVLIQGDSKKAVKNIMKKFPSVKIITSKINLGPTKGRNEGVKMARGKYFIFLDDDTKVKPTWLEELVKAVQNYPSHVGIFGSYEVPYDKEVEYVGNHGVCDILGCSFGDYNGYGINAKYNFFETLEFAMLVKREAFEKIDGFDSRYFISGGLDFCWRVRLVGYEIVNIRSAVVHHATGLTKNYFIPKKIYFMERNQIATVIKNYDTITLIFIAPILFNHILIEASLFLLIRKVEFSLTIIKAVIWNIKNFKANWTLHLKTQKNRKISDKDIMKKMTNKNLKALKMCRFIEKHSQTLNL